MPGPESRAPFGPPFSRERLDPAAKVETDLGCSLYTEPSTPTVMRITSSLRLSRMRFMTPASPAEHMWAARVDTLSQARRTMSQSVTEGRSPRVLRMLWICLRSPESLRAGWGREVTGGPQGMRPAVVWSALHSLYSEGDHATAVARMKWRLWLLVVGSESADRSPLD